MSSHSEDNDGATEHNSRISLSGPSQSSQTLGKPPACVHCKSLKVRCQYSPGEEICQRCKFGNQPCLPRDRKRRKAAPTHQELQERAHKQDVLIQSLLLHYDKLKANERMKTWTLRTQSKDGIKLDCNLLSRPDAQPAETYIVSHFSAGVEALCPPDILKHCSLSTRDITDLFSLFFEIINPFFSILDPELHTPERLVWTCPFLFTVICAVASRYHSKKPGLYPLAMEFAREAARRALVDGSKSVEVCQAYLLMGVYPVPKKKWVQDRSWLLMGVAIRMALELQLNQPPPADCEERERLNRMRTWLNCYCVDGSHAIQFGKIPMLSLDDYLARHSRHWYKSSPMNSPYDVHLTGYVHIILIVAQWRSAMGGETQPLPSGPDIVTNVLETQEKLAIEFSWWSEAYAEELLHRPLPICAYRGNTTRLITSYLRLVILAVGFQHAAKLGITRGSQLVSMATKVAREVIHIMVDRLYPTGNLRFALEANFLYVSFAAAFLVNLLRPEFLPLLDESLHEGIIQDVEGLINVLGSTDVALDGRHTPALYSRFLSSLLAKHRDNYSFAFSDSRPPHNEPTLYRPWSYDQQVIPQDGDAILYTWPDVIPAGGFPAIANEDGLVFQTQDVMQQCGVEMDLSLAYFHKTVTQGFPLGPPVELSSSPLEEFDWTSVFGLM